MSLFNRNPFIDWPLRELEYLNEQMTAMHSVFIAGGLDDLGDGPIDRETFSRRFIPVHGSEHPVALARRDVMTAELPTYWAWYARTLDRIRDAIVIKSMAAATS